MLYKRVRLIRMVISDQTNALGLCLCFALF